MIGRYTAVTAAAAALCLCIAVVQVLDLANTRVALEDVPGVQEPQPQYIHLTDNNGFGTNAAFIGMADGQGSSVRAARAQQLAGFALSNENLAKIQFSQKNGYRPNGVVQLPDAGDMGTNSAYLGQVHGATPKMRSAASRSRSALPVQPGARGLETSCAFAAGPDGVE